MIDDPDIRRGAIRMVEHYGANAAAAARARAADLIRAGECSAAEIWQEIVRAIETIWTKCPEARSGNS